MNSQISTFSAAFSLAMRANQDTPASLERKLRDTLTDVSKSTLLEWKKGLRRPSRKHSFSVLNAVEKLYDLPLGHFKKILKDAPIIYKISERQVPRSILDWHTPNDFASRTTSEQKQIIDWIRENIAFGSSDYHQFRSTQKGQYYSVLFPKFSKNWLRMCDHRQIFAQPESATRVADEIIYGNSLAPSGLQEEMASLLHFKCATLTPTGFQRANTWNEVTALSNVRVFGLFFGALTAERLSYLRGADVPLDELSFAILTFPRVWDWYLNWRQERRGSFCETDKDLLVLGAGLTHPKSGWLCQVPSVSYRLKPSPGLISEANITTAQEDWALHCSNLRDHLKERIRNISKLTTAHYDPFQPILPVLESSSPLKLYLTIADEILKNMPDLSVPTRNSAEIVRDFLMFRIAIHLGIRKKNLRQLLLCLPGQAPLSEAELTVLKRGQIQWNIKSCSWVVYIPSSAFKNGRSPFFRRHPYILSLPNVGRLYEFIDEYVSKSRPLLLCGQPDPGNFFIRTGSPGTKTSLEYKSESFFRAWRTIIQKYGIYNPFTNRGAIEGLLPHGPHNIRDIIATHILKVTGSHEQASYAIQDTPETVAKYYSRFLPSDKAVMASHFLNDLFED